MKLYNTENDTVVSLQEMHKKWAQFKNMDSLNHADNFKTELYNILLDAINGRNNYKVVNLTMNETCNYILKLANK